jgi:hypothetical protein
MAPIDNEYFAFTVLSCYKALPMAVITPLRPGMLITYSSSRIQIDLCIHPMGS